MKIWNPEVELLDGSQVEPADSFLFSYQVTKRTKGAFLTILRPFPLRDLRVLCV